VWGDPTGLFVLADKGKNDRRVRGGGVKGVCGWGGGGGGGGGGGWRAVAESVELNFTRLSPPA